MNAALHDKLLKTVLPKSILTAFCLVFFTAYYNSQTALDINADVDTLKSSYKASGELTKVDLLPPYSMSTFGYNSSSSSFNFVHPFQFLPSGGQLYTFKEPFPMRYTSLPHISFAYCFGSSGFQFTKVQYSQAFLKGVIINLDFSNNQSAGILRNSAYQDRDVLLRISKSTKRLHSLVSTQFINRNFQWNGGITNDSLPLDFSLDLIPVNKSDASSASKEVNIGLLNKFTIKNDSIRKIGLYLSNVFLSKNRIYTETGNLSSSYSMINFDSTETRDHFQISTLENEIGTDIHQGHWKLNAGLMQRFWNYRNNQIYRDTLELAVKESIQYSSQSIRFNQSFEYFIRGRSVSYSNKTKYTMNFGKWNVLADWSIENSLPDLLQRHYSANNVNYQLQSYQLQFKNNIGLSTSYSFAKHTVGMKASHMFLKNPYFFDGQIWKNDIFTSLQLFKMDFTVDFHWKGFSFNPQYSLLLQPTNLTFHPTHVAKARIGLKGGIFKNKKLLSYIGIEPQWIGSYNRISFLPVMDVFLVNQLAAKQKGFFDLAFYTGFELKGFRFFARAENMGYFWNNRMLQTVKGYPIPPLQIRLGITWDFWN
jgi:hypothetical protein